jgi:signal transduction histidine kinase
VEQTSAVIPVERIGFFVLKQPGNRLTTQAQINFDLFERYSVRFEAEKLRTELQLPVAIDGLVEPGIRFEPADAAVFRRWEMAIVFPMLSESREFLGFLVLGKKKSGRRFSGEDVDLLNTVAAQAGLAIERITLQKKLLLKEAEADQLAELNQLKSDFVSYVSHELRTPLTSIKLFAELLRERNNNDSKSKNYIGSIIGEANRLDRMVTAILDSARIDHGVKEYTLVPCDLGEIASGVMSIMSYQLTKQRFRVAFRRPKRPLPVRADPDAVAMALMNLISNAIKYSGEHKRLQIILRRSNSDVVCKVQDRGRGIPEDAIPHLFKKFYRQSVQANDPGGFGLGLSLVKHIMDAHAGRVTVESRAARGSTFTLHFPLDPIQGVTTKVKNRC